MTLPLKQKTDSRAGLSFPRVFSRSVTHPFKAVKWERRDAIITGADGTEIFCQREVEFPAQWSQTATNIVAQKYFRGALGSKERETSVKQMVSRVADAICEWGKASKYFADDVAAEIFRDELMVLLLHQKMAFNSPVWFNVGVEAKPQCSACFINSVDDSLASVLSLAKTEGLLFKFGSGSGTNLSSLRGSGEMLTGGGTASGPVSFMRGLDAFAGAIKSGGKTRRAAKMVILNIDHPDIVSFIECKAEEESKARALIEAGYDGGFDIQGGAYDSVRFQNANHSVRVTDDFMLAVEEDEPWNTVTRDGRVFETRPARELMRRMADAAHRSGDPGIQFDTTINRWHTCPNSGRINASNPCSEYMFLDDSACNLASLNLMAFTERTGTIKFDVHAYMHAIKITMTAMDILVGWSSYPTESITENSLEFRPLGLGMANLGSLLMQSGLPYDSEVGRAQAAAIAALTCGHAYAVSAEIAKAMGPFGSYHQNRKPMAAVIRKHRDALEEIDSDLVPVELWHAAENSWDQALTLGEDYGYRNSQATVIAPTGTISFLMDCQTTGIEPELSLVKYKTLVGGGQLKLITSNISNALCQLGYLPEERILIQAHVEEHGTVEGSAVRSEHLPVFDCALRAPNATRSIGIHGHVHMLAAIQPFVSGAISKTVNMPTDATVEDVETVYTEAWRLGLKSIAVYRDGSKRTQPLSTVTKPYGPGEQEAKDLPPGPPAAIRHKLPSERRSLTHKFSVGGHEGYITVGFYDDGHAGEIFVRMAKEGSVIAGLMDSFATSVSLALQHGVPLPVLCEKFKGTRFEPSGFTGNTNIPIATSFMDYIFRWLETRFHHEQVVDAVDTPKVPSPTYSVQESAAPPCSECGTLLVPNGSCYGCPNCGATTGCS